MLKLSKLTDYAVVILAEMATNERALLNASALAARTKLPEPTVSKVLKTLTKNGLIHSTRGSNGGYVLQKQPSDIDMASVITALEGPIALTQCVDKVGDEYCDRAANCSVRGKWNPVNNAMQNALKNVSLAQMIGAQS